MHLPPIVDIREVGLRDGLQLESPVPTETKLSILEAVAATGVSRVEVTSFVSRSAVPALARVASAGAEIEAANAVGVLAATGADVRPWLADRRKTVADVARRAAAP